MKFLKRPSSPAVDTDSMNNQKKPAQVTRILASLVLAFMMFAFIGLTTSGPAFASSPSTCGDQVRASSEAEGYSTAEDVGTFNLVQNTCTGLYHAEVVCSKAGNTMTVFIEVIIKPGVTHGYNTINVTCGSAGQIFDTASMARPSSIDFCAWGFADDPTGDGGPAIACI